MEKTVANKIINEVLLPLARQGKPESAEMLKVLSDLVSQPETPTKLTNPVLVLDGRGSTGDVDSFMTKYLPLFNGALNPFLVFNVSNGSVVVSAVESIQELLTFSDDCRVMAQWPGKGNNRRDDFFQFTVGDVRKVNPTP